MKVIEAELPGCLIFEPRVFGDDRGFFYESFNADKLAPQGLDLVWKQGNVSSSTHGVLRGLHYQWPKPQGKLVSVVQGEVWDVAVDIRKISPTFGRWVGAELSEENQHQLWVPPGFAHGFIVLSDSADFLYKTTDYYAPAHERCILWNDETLAIHWPAGIQPILSAKDAQGKAFVDAEVFA